MEPSLGNTFIIFRIIEHIICCITILLHGVGVLAICRDRKRCNQNKILLLLSFTEIAAITVRVGYNVARVDFAANRLMILNTFLRSMFYITTYLLLSTMFVLTLDRLLCAAVPIRYKLPNTERNIKMAIILALVLSLMFGLTTGLMSSVTLRRQLIIVINIFGSLYLIFAITTYTYIIIKTEEFKKAVPTKGRKEPVEISQGISHVWYHHFNICIVVWVSSFTQPLCSVERQ